MSDNVRATSLTWSIARKCAGSRHNRGLAEGCARPLVSGAIMMKSSPPTSFPKSDIKVLLLENVHESAHEIFRGQGFQIEAIPRALKEDELVAKLDEGVHILGIRSKTQVTRRALESGKRLLSVGAFCIGTNQIDLVAANAAACRSSTRRSATRAASPSSSSARSSCSRASSAIARARSTRASGARSRRARHEVRGKTLGIIGYGHIGSQVGVLAEAMGMRVIFYDIRTTLPMGNNKAVESLDELLAASDFVTLHVPETPQTQEHDRRGRARAR